MTALDQLWVLGDLYTFHLSTPEIAIIEIESDFHHGPPPHSHEEEVETLYVIEGELDVVRGSETLAAGKGSFVHLPKGVVHTFKTRGPEGSRTRRFTELQGGGKKTLKNVRYGDWPEVKTDSFLG